MSWELEDGSFEMGVFEIIQKNLTI
jgi:hypothetical protein